jgi:hypothetical protein
MGGPYSSSERLRRSQELGIIVDPQDEWLLSEYTWHVSKFGYAQGNVKLGHNRYLSVLLHHFITGVPIHPFEVDHWDRNKMNNRRSNLRYIIHRDNVLNSERIDNATNIYYRKSTGKYAVLFNAHRVDEFYVGSFATQHEAEQARDEYLESGPTDRHVRRRTPRTV